MQQLVMDLGAAPKMIIILKNLDIFSLVVGRTYWYVYHASLGSNKYLLLNLALMMQ